MIGSDEASGFRRSAGSPRGEARRRDLLTRVADDLAANGLVDFSLRRAARAAGTTHKVLLYYFRNAEDLLAQAVLELRQRRIDNAMAAALSDVHGDSLADRIRAVWPVVAAPEARVLDQAIGLMLYDPSRYAELGHDATQQYLPTLVALCPAAWSERRKLEVAHMILATLRGFLITRLTGGHDSAVEIGFEALARALDREEAATD